MLHNHLSLEVKIQDIKLGLANDKKNPWNV